MKPNVKAKIDPNLTKKMFLYNHDFWFYGTRMYLESNP